MRPTKALLPLCGQRTGFPVALSCLARTAQVRPPLLPVPHDAQDVSEWAATVRAGRDFGRALATLGVVRKSSHGLLVALRTAVAALLQAPQPALDGSHGPPLEGSVAEDGGPLTPGGITATPLRHESASLVMACSTHPAPGASSPRRTGLVEGRRKGQTAGRCLEPAVRPGRGRAPGR